MRVAGYKVWSWALGLGLGAGTAALAQNSAQVPDAPKPQTLPRLNTITPAAPATSTSAPAGTATPAPAATQTPQAAADAADNGGVAPGATLPSAPSNQTPAQAETEADAGAPPEQHAANIRVQVNFHQIAFTVKDSKGQLVPGLTPRDVRVYENGLRQQLRLFSVDPAPLSVAIVIDQSVTFQNMEKINSALNALQGAFAPFDEVAIYTYNNGVKEQTAFSGAQSTRVTYALERSKSTGREAYMGMGGPLSNTTVKNNLPVDPNTNGNNRAGVIMETPPREFHTLNDALLTAAETVARAGKGRRRVIYVISDGREYGSKATVKEVIRYLQTNEITVFGTLVGETTVPGIAFLDRIHLPLTMRDNVLPKYTTATGGDYDGAFRPRGIQDSFSKLAAQVRTQYTVGYYSHEPFINSKYRSTEVRVMRPNLDVVAPPGYYPRADGSLSMPTASNTNKPAPAPPTE
jgi:VWFA-related protein